MVVRILKRATPTVKRDIRFYCYPQGPMALTLIASVWQWSKWSTDQSLINNGGLVIIIIIIIGFPPLLKRIVQLFFLIPINTLIL